MQQAVRWRLFLENPADGLKVPQQQRNEMRSLTIEQVRALLKPQKTQSMGQCSQSHSRLPCARVNTWVRSGKT